MSMETRIQTLERKLARQEQVINRLLDLVTALNAKRGQGVSPSRRVVADQDARLSLDASGRRAGSIKGGRR